MADTRSEDWIPPALLILAAVLLGLVGWGIWTATNQDGGDETAAGRLEKYTACLRDHGANVPVVETRADGGLAIIVPGSLLEGDIDLERWQDARSECRQLEPDPLELLFSSGALSPLFDRGFATDFRGPGLSEICERLERGGADRDVPREFGELCGALGG